MKTPKEYLEAGAAILDKKAADYTTLSRYENFERVAAISEWFVDPQDKVFAMMIGTKLARLASLLGRDKVPNNESIEDTFTDLINYGALWAGKRSEMADNEIPF